MFSCGLEVDNKGKLPVKQKKGKGVHVVLWRVDVGHEKQNITGTGEKKKKTVAEKRSYY